MNFAYRALDLAVARLCDYPAVRAGNPNTTNWGIGRLLQRKDPAVRAAAYKTALDRVHASPKLALQILSGDFQPEQKLAVVKKLREEMVFPGPFQVAGSSNIPLAITFNTLPKFFELLGRRSSDFVASVNSLWSATVPVRMPGFMFRAEEQLREISKGYSVIDREVPLVITPRVSQLLIGYNYLAPEKAAAEDSLYFLSACVIDGYRFDYTYSRKEPERLDPLQLQAYVTVMEAARQDRTNLI